MYRNFVKPLLDFIISFILIIVFSPLMLIVLIITVIDLGFPIHNLIRKREGKNRKTFIMYKFRTKALDKDGTTNSNTYTKVSRFIDKTRLNELPQLFNVLRGQMSLVGPRPFIPYEADEFRDQINEKRYLVRPGLTGLAQVNGGRTISQTKKLEYDAIYYDNMSFMLDLTIILRTIVQTFSKGIDSKK